MPLSPSQERAQRRSLFRSFDIFTIEWSEGWLAGTMSLPTQHAADVLEETQGRNSKAVRNDGESVR